MGGTPGLKNNKLLVMEEWRAVLMWMGQKGRDKCHSYLPGRHGIVPQKKGWLLISFLYSLK